MREKNRILITGLPGCGKTTLIKRIAAHIRVPYCGFFTNEIRSGGNRVGFEIETFTGTKGILSHIDIQSSYHVGKYGVDVLGFQKIAIPEMEKALSSGHLLIIDEIGKMELCSDMFRDMLEKAFRSSVGIIATILFKPHPFCDRLKNNKDTEVIVLTKGAQEQVFKALVDRFLSLRIDH